MDSAIRVLFAFALLFVAADMRGNTAVRQFDLLCDELRLDGYEQRQHADSLINRLFYLSNRQGNPPELLARAVYFRVAYGYDINQYSPEVEKMLPKIGGDSVSLPRGLALLSEAMIENVKGNYSEAMGLALKARDVMTAIGYGNGIARTETVMGDLFEEIGENDNAVQSYKRALAYYRSENNVKNELRTLLNIYDVFFVMGRKETVIRSLQALMPRINAAKSSYLRSIAFTNLGSYLARTAQLKEAMACYEEALNDAGWTGNDYHRISVVHNIATLYLREARPDSCLKYMMEARNYYLAHNISNRLPSTYVVMSLAWEQKGNYKKAFENFVRYDSVRNKLSGNERISAVNRTVASFEQERHTNELRMAEARYTIKQKQVTIVVISAIGVLALAAMGLWVMAKQRKIAMQEKELREVENRHLSERLDREKQEFTQTIDSRNREISASLLLLSGKNSALRRILRIVESPSADQKAVKREIESLIKSNLDFDEEWNEFKVHFEQVHPDFFSKLRHLSAGLTENDLRLCSYIRIGMRNKEIAQLLSVSPDSVKMSRYRIKKKLPDAADMTLDEYLNKI